MKANSPQTLAILFSAVLAASACAADSTGEGEPPRGQAPPKAGETREPHGELRGLYVYMADAALFTECETGKRYPVAFEGDSGVLERAYLEARRQPGDELLISLEGRFAERPAMEGGGTVTSLVVDRFIGVWPGETCGARGTVSELLDTYWKLTRLGDQPVVLAENQPEPHLVLRSNDNRVSGFGGCNSFSGTYTVEGQSITFGNIATTAMACPHSEDVEMALMSALAEASNFRLMPHHLEMFDDEGQMVARFEAREMP
jgi:copper homeostasis protein (lipoprotein)